MYTGTYNPLSTEPNKYITHHVKPGLESGTTWKTFVRIRTWLEMLYPRKGRVSMLCVCVCARACIWKYVVGFDCTGRPIHSDSKDRRRSTIVYTNDQNAPPDVGLDEPDLPRGERHIRELAALFGFDFGLTIVWLVRPHVGDAVDQRPVVGSSCTFPSSHQPIHQPKNKQHPRSQPNPKPQTKPHNDPPAGR